MRSPIVALIVILSNPVSAFALGVLEVPAGHASGVGFVAGWKCAPVGNLTVQFDDKPPLPLAKGISRGDTAGVCENSGLNGFIAQFNYNLLGDGEHVAKVFDNGVEFAQQEFHVKTLGESFREDLVGSTGFDHFPGIGDSTTLTWIEGLQNFVITDIALPDPAPIHRDNFEGGIGFWSVNNGVWEVGTPTSGPSSCRQGDTCAATVLDGTYPEHSSSLISPSIDLPFVDPGAELQLRFWEWHLYGHCDSGRVQIQVYDEDSETWSSLVDIAGSGVGGSSGGVWSLKSVDLSSHEGERVRIAFTSVANNTSPFDGCTAGGDGWYIDEVAIISIP